ncbi:MAG: aldo/keto reductase [Verrucomicrobiae bacterium]|nr:aldo/keto reductase [Verrucomicrobiae bacterium]
MHHVPLGVSDLAVSRICFGCWQLSPQFWGDVPLDGWRAAVRRAPDLGVNFLDTADAYGDGFAETELGRLFADPMLRDRFVLATKFYWNFDESETRFPDTRRARILRACENSLMRLRTDRIDLYQVHAWDALTRPDEVAEALIQLRREGKIRWIGVSNFNVEQLAVYRARMEVVCLQPPYSLLARDVEARELPYCLANRIGVIAYSPLFRGLLTGKHAPGTKLGDSRDEHPFFAEKALGRLQAGLAKLQPLADAEGLTLAQFAVRWVITHPALTSAIVGVKKPEHLEGIVKAAEGALSQETWHRAAKIMASAKKDAEALREQP